jgi:hypothetical protein
MVAVTVVAVLIILIFTTVQAANTVPISKVILLELAVVNDAHTLSNAHRAKPVLFAVTDAVISHAYPPYWVFHALHIADTDPVPVVSHTPITDTVSCVQ